MSDIRKDPVGDTFEFYNDILHLHCTDCYKTDCKEQQNCRILKCPYGCEMSFHSCKTEDHKVICLVLLRPCLNAVFGCPYKVSRQNQPNHLNVCPANVVHCRMHWNRYPVYSRERYTLSNIYSSTENKIKQVREHWIPFPQVNPPLIKGQLDVELAYSDQRKLEREKSRVMKIGQWNASRFPNRRKIDLVRIKKLESLMGKSESSNGLSNGEVVDNWKLSSSLGGLDEESGLISSDSCDHLITTDMPNMIMDDYSDDSLGVDDQGINVLRNERVVPIAEKTSEPNDSECGARESMENKSKEDFEKILKITEGSDDVGGNALLVEDTSCVAPDFPKRFTEHASSAYKKTLGLNVIIEAIPTFEKSYPMYSIPCQTDLRRDQYAAHFKNVHSDIHGGLNTWIQQRCPLAQYGCPFIRHRLKPVSRGCSLVFDHDIGNFGVKLDNCVDLIRSTTEDGLDFSSLPFEVIERIVLFLDNFSINQFAKSCKTMRDVCRALVQRKGIVLQEWQRGVFSDGSVSWKIYKTRWLFTPSFSYVHKWVYTDEPAMGEHMKHCQFFYKLKRTEDFKLPMDNSRAVKLVKVNGEDNSS